MRSKLKMARLAAVAASVITAAFAAQGSGVAAQDRAPTLVLPRPELHYSSVPVVQATLDAAPARPAVDDGDSPEAATLVELVAAQAQPDSLPQQLQCLAGAIYFEAKGETLPGQLAVARVIVSRAKSGRFPDSYCGVVYQPSQFSFVRGAGMPTIRTRSRAWREAVAIAQIADSGSWKSRTEGALFFHAARVSPGWRMTRIARVDDHIFYR